MHIEALTLQRIAELYRDYLNHPGSLTVEVFAGYYNLSVQDAEKVILIGRFIHEQGL